MAYNEVIAAHDIAGDVLEIGVHHGLSALALAAIRRDGAQLRGHRPVRRAPGAKRLGVPAAAAARVSCGTCASSLATSRSCGASRRHPTRSAHADLGSRFSFCHVDGGHTARETYEDLDLCSRILLPGGLLALDDYFNPAFPGVCEGAIKFWLAHDGALTPIAAGFNKVLFQKAPAPFDLNAAFTRRFPYIPHKTATLWETPIHSFSSFAAFIDTRASSPRGLLPNESFRMDASLTFQTGEVTAHGGGTIRIPVRVVNRSTIPFVAGTGCGTVRAVIPPAVRRRARGAIQQRPKLFRAAARARRRADRRPGRRRAEGSRAATQSRPTSSGKASRGSKTVDSTRRVSGCSWSR